MRLCIKTLVCLSGLFLINACTLFKKEITKPLIVSMSDTSFNVLVTSTADYMKYSATYSKEQIAKAFLIGFKHEASITKNVSLQFDDAGADFIVKVKMLTITESTRSDTIKNPKSPYNGQMVRLNVLESRADLEVTDVKHHKALGDCTNSKSRSEKETNNRSLDELVAGTNKDNTQYRTKLLDNDICLTLTQDVGRRIWMPLTRRMAKAIK
jgi:hypothetical protein